jgi:hypothetical protein
MTVRVLAFDLSTRVGVAADRLPGADPALGPLMTTYKLDFEGEDFGPAYVQLRRFALQMVSTYRPHRVIYEAPWVLTGSHRPDRGTKASVAIFLISLTGVIDLVAAECGLPCNKLPVQSVRAEFLDTAYPKEPKEAVIARCKSLGWFPRNDHEADAAALWAVTKATFDSAFTASLLPIFRNQKPQGGVHAASP